MKNLWSDREARSFVRRYAKECVNRDRALRVYTSRLLGRTRGSSSAIPSPLEFDA